ncbi:hypothetical protein [Brevibacterium luteolum]|uniref:hypothetical protein n=1 Tax=Brevibacterium luteolum TaxID=199591 RepID=UPI00223B923E|nr:hypothetical protein [Brevibacterium luteolum]MCT1658206.1 hypothetical protein [Brevibacterium luteolum]MCT1920934.1 hypothetical protein [Brevibacterium luteolum]
MRIELSEFVSVEAAVAAVSDDRVTGVLWCGVEPTTYLDLPLPIDAWRVALASQLGAVGLDMQALCAVAEVTATDIWEAETSAGLDALEQGFLVTDPDLYREAYGVLYGGV